MLKLPQLMALCGIQLPFVPEIAIKELYLDSRQVSKDDMFIAIRGNNVDGREYIEQAIANGVIAVLAETAADSPSIEMYKSIPVIFVPDLVKRVSEIAGQFYQHPSHQLSTIGVTGTNGKTTITQLIAQWASLLNTSSGVMGTIGNGFIGNLISSANTTGSAIDIQRELSKYQQQGMQLVAMEISSHGLVQHRVAALLFSAVVFSNLSRDHLDYHGTMEAYQQAKWLLFGSHESKNKIVNIDDDVGKVWFQELHDAILVSTKNKLPIASASKWLITENIIYHSQGATIDFKSTWGDGQLQSSLIGEFNVSNLLLAMATLLSLGYPLLALVKTVERLQAVVGRMELFQQSAKPSVIVDYAHTPDALEKALQAALQHCTGKLWCVFGCGGDRDSGKRPLMGAIAEQYADQVIITSDNPRTEDPHIIINDICQGLLNAGRSIVIPDRKEAIIYTIQQASSNDIILLAGKGHENYQIIGRNRFYFSDRDIVAQQLGLSI